MIFGLANLALGYDEWLYEAMTLFPADPVMELDELLGYCNVDGWDGMLRSVHVQDLVANCKELTFPVAQAVDLSGSEFGVSLCSGKSYILNPMFPM